MKRHKHMVRRLVLVAAALVLGLYLYNWNASSVLGNQMPMPFGWGVSYVCSGSMLPTLAVNDLVVIRETESVEIGDILVYQSGNSLVIHRLIAAEGDMLILQGDANNLADDPISMEAVKGKLIYTVPGGGVLVRALQQPAVILVILALAVLLMELSFRKEKEADADELDAIQQEIQQLLSEIKKEE